LQTTILLLGAALFVITAYGDVTTRRIPNALVAAVAALGLFRITFSGDASAVLYTIAASGAIFVATFLLFWRGLLGGGDVKLMSATALLVGYHDLTAFLFVMSICGALISLAVLARQKLAPPTASPGQEPLQTSARLTVPYGVAIAAAGILTLFFQSSLSG
jgi:prepilin peptidase CpaA